jgi:hypothetical protein
MLRPAQIGESLGLRDSRKGLAKHHANSDLILRGLGSADLRLPAPLCQDQCEADARVPEAINGHT